MIPLNLSAALAGRKKFVEANDDNTSAGAAGAGTGSLMQLRAANDTGMVFIDKSPTGFTGLINQGATCYLNSLLQTLYCTPEFKAALYRSNFKSNNNSSEDVGDATMNLCRQLQILFTELQFTTRGAVTTSALTKSFGWSSRDSFQQQDVQECMTVIFEFIKMSYPESEIASWLNEQWQGEIKSSLVRDMKTLSSSLSAYFADEELEGVECETCGARHSHSQQKSLDADSLPQVLTIQLRRFDMDWNTFQRVKVYDALDIPRSLTLSPTLLHAPPALRASCSYELSSVMMHSGSAFAGHYFAYIKTHSPDPQTQTDSSQSQWLLFNDSNVTALTEEEVEGVFASSATEKEKEKGEENKGTMSAADHQGATLSPAEKAKGSGSGSGSGSREQARRKQLLPVSRHAYMLVYRRVRTPSSDKDRFRDSTQDSSDEQSGEHSARTSTRTNSNVNGGESGDGAGNEDKTVSLPNTTSAVNVTVAADTDTDSGLSPPLQPPPSVPTAIVELWQEVQADNLRYQTALERHQREREYLHITVHRQRIGTGPGGAGSTIPPSAAGAGTGAEGVHVKVIRIHQDQSLKDLTDIVHSSFYSSGIDDVTHPIVETSPPVLIDDEHKTSPVDKDSHCVISRKQIRLRAYDVIKNETLPAITFFPALKNRSAPADSIPDTASPCEGLTHHPPQPMSQLEAEESTLLKDIDEAHLQKYIYIEVDHASPTGNDGKEFSPYVDGEYDTDTEPKSLSTGGQAPSMAASSCTVLLRRYSRCDGSVKADAITSLSQSASLSPPQSVTLSADMSWSACRRAFLSTLYPPSSHSEANQQRGGEHSNEEKEEGMVVVAVLNDQEQGHQEFGSVCTQRAVVVTDQDPEPDSSTQGTKEVPLSTSIQALLSAANTSSNSKDTNTLTLYIDVDPVPPLPLPLPPPSLAAVASCSDKLAITLPLIEYLNQRLNQVTAQVTCLDVHAKTADGTQTPPATQQLMVPLDARMTLAAAKLRIAEATHWRVESFRFVTTRVGSQEMHEMRDMNILLSSLVTTPTSPQQQQQQQQQQQSQQQSQKEEQETAARGATLAALSLSSPARSSDASTHTAADHSCPLSRQLSLSLTVENIPALALGDIRVTLYLKELAVHTPPGAAAVSSSSATGSAAADSSVYIPLNSVDRSGSGSAGHTCFVFHEDEFVSDIKQRIAAQYEACLRARAGVFTRAAGGATIHAPDTLTGIGTGTNTDTDTAVETPLSLRLQLLLVQTPAPSVSDTHSLPADSTAPTRSPSAGHPLPYKATLVLSDDLTVAECLQSTSTSSSSCSRDIAALCVTVCHEEEQGQEEGKGQGVFHRDTDMLLTLWEWMPVACRQSRRSESVVTDTDSSTHMPMITGVPGGGGGGTDAGSPYLCKVREVVVPQVATFGDIRRLLRVRGVGGYSDTRSEQDEDEQQEGGGEETPIYFAKPFLWQLRTNPEENIPQLKWANQPSSDDCLLMGAPFRLQTNNRSRHMVPPMLLFKRCLPHQLVEIPDECSDDSDSDHDHGKDKDKDSSSSGSCSKRRKKGKGKGGGGKRREEGGGFQLFTPQQQAAKQREERQQAADREHTLQALTGGSNKAKPLV